MEGEIPIRVGDSVEICCDEDGFLGSYFEAKVVARVAGGDEFLVEYKNLVTEEDEEEPLKEVVPASKVRPTPPNIRVPEFQVLDKVDAFDNDGWWVGRITGKYGFRYYVYFDSSGDEILYSFSCLRPHQEYENGKWIASRAGLCC